MNEGSNQESPFTGVLRIINEPLPGTYHTLNVVRRIEGTKTWIVADNLQDTHAWNRDKAGGMEIDPMKNSRRVSMPSVGFGDPV